MKHLAYWGFSVGLHQDVSLNGFFVFVHDCFFELKRDLVARLHIVCITSSVATCLMSGDVPMTKQQGVLGVYLVRFQTTRQNSQGNPQSGLANGLHGLNSRNTEPSTPLASRTALIRRLLIPLVLRWNPSQCGKRTNPSSALGAFCVFNTLRSLEREGRDGSIHPWRTVVERKLNG